MPHECNDCFHILKNKSQHPCVTCRRQYRDHWEPIVKNSDDAISTEKTGQWIHIFMENGDDYFEAWDITGVHTFAAQYRCDKCGFVHTVIEDLGRYSYCPNCGAKMEVKK